MLKERRQAIDEIVVSGLRAGKSLLAEAMGGVVVKPTPAFTAPDGSEVVNPIDEPIATPEFKAGDVVKVKDVDRWGWVPKLKAGKVEVCIVHDATGDYNPGASDFWDPSQIEHYLQPGDEVELLDCSKEWPERAPTGGMKLNTPYTLDDWDLGTTAEILPALAACPLCVIRETGNGYPLSCIRPVRK
jgi:hypothetical protein